MFKSLARLGLLVAVVFLALVGSGATPTAAEVPASDSLWYLPMVFHNNYGWNSSYLTLLQKRS
jgi:hypothetical protein